MKKEIPNPFRRAYLKGKIAANIGLDKDKNPYQDKLNKHGNPTWSRTFRRYWFEGFNNHKSEGFKILK